MKTSTPLILKSAKELLGDYKEGKKYEERIKKSILRLIKSIPPSEAELHREKIDAILNKLK